VSHAELIGAFDDHAMKTPTSSNQQSWLEILWALVVLQGGILVLSSVESLFVNALFGFSLIGVFILTACGAFLTLRTARGLRLRKRWARRVTLFAEWFVLAIGVIEVGASIAIPGASAGLVPVLTRVVVPIAVLVFLRRTKPLFAGEIEEDVDAGDRQPTEDPILGVLV